MSFPLSLKMAPIKRLKGHMVLDGTIPSEDKWNDKAIKSLVKNLRKTNQLDALEKAVEYKDDSTPCITIQRPLDGRLQVGPRKCWPHVFYCQLWRWPDLQSQHELRPILSCKFPFHRKCNEVCINPYHYFRVENPSILVPRFLPMRGCGPLEPHSCSACIDIDSSTDQRRVSDSVSPSPCCLCSCSQSSSSGGSSSLLLDVSGSLLLARRPVLHGHLAPPNTSPHMPPPPTLHNINTNINNNVTLDMMDSSDQSGGMVQVGHGDLSRPTSTSSISSSSSPSTSSPQTSNSPVVSCTYHPTPISSPCTPASSNATTNTTNNNTHSTPSSSNTCTPQLPPSVVRCQHSSLFTSVPYQVLEDWCSVCYFEFNHRVGDIFRCSSPRLVIDGFTHFHDYPHHHQQHHHQQQQPQQQHQHHHQHPQEPNDRFCLGRVTNANRLSEAETTRKHIGKGITLYFLGGDVLLECNGDSAVFVQSTNCNFMNEWDIATVAKVPPGCKLIIFDNMVFTKLLRASVQTSYDAVFDLMKMCSLRISLVKGWGSEYKRPDITAMPCWIEVHLHGPLMWLDRVLHLMGSSSRRCPSLSFTSSH